MNKVCAMTVLYASFCYAAENDRLHMQPYSVYRQAADKLLGAVPQPMKTQQRLSSEVLAHQLELIDSKRVENHTLIEQILHQESPLRSEGAALLLLQINNAVAVESEKALQQQQRKHNVWSGLTFAAFISTLAVVLSSQ